MMFVGLMFAIAASKTMPPSESSDVAPFDALSSDPHGSSANEHGPASSDHTTLQQSPIDGPSLAGHTAGLLDQLDVFVLTRPDLLKESLTYYRGFDNPILAELDRWHTLGMEYSDTPALCRDALVRLQSIGISIHGGSAVRKFVEEDKAKYLNLKRRCKAAVAGDIAEAARRE